MLRLGEKNWEGSAHIWLDDAGPGLPLRYQNAKEAQQAFGYLMEAIKRGDRLADI